MREDVRDLLKELYGRTCRWQTAKGIRVDLTEEQFIAKWSRYRINKFEKLLDKGRKAVLANIRNPETKPVCGWLSSAERDTGVMHDGNCRIMPASEQRKLFQFKKGDKHSEETKAAMRKPKSDKTKKNMSTGQTRRWENYRAEQAANKGD